MRRPKRTSQVKKTKAKVKTLEKKDPMTPLKSPPDPVEIHQGGNILLLFKIIALASVVSLNTDVWLFAGCCKIIDHGEGGFFVPYQCLWRCIYSFYTDQTAIDLYSCYYHIISILDFFKIKTKTSQ